MMSSSEKLDRSCFDCFYTHSGDQEILLAITFNGRIILHRTMKQFRPLPSTNNKNENPGKITFVSVSHFAAGLLMSQVHFSSAFFPSIAFL